MSAQFPVSKYVECAGWEIHYWEWGASDLPPIIAWHGLARVGYDFNVLGHELSSQYRVIAPDTIGRGFSAWSEDADRDYCFAVYGTILEDLCSKLGLSTFGWVGTSMGGAFGIWAAGGILKKHITHLVINDIGPEIPKEATDRIVKYIGSPPEFTTMIELERYLRVIYAPFGYIPGDEWRQFTESSARRLPNGKFTTHYDPNIVKHFTLHREDWRLWKKYNAISAKTLLLRGEYSDLLTEDMTKQMLEEGSNVSFLECKGCGHAPALNVPFQTEAIKEFLAS